MNLFLTIGGLVVILFGLVVVRGAPYLPTLRRHTDDALDLLDLKPGQTILELGCGDGRVARRAAERGLNVIGYELNPLLVIVAQIHTWRYRKQVKIIWGDFWQSKWPPADGIFVFLLEKYMKKLDKKIIQTYQGQPIKVASFVYELPGKKPYKAKDGVLLYHY